MELRSAVYVALKGHRKKSKFDLVLDVTNALLGAGCTLMVGQLTGLVGQALKNRKRSGTKKTDLVNRIMGRVDNAVHMSSVAHITGDDQEELIGLA